MRVTRTEIPDVLVLEPRVFRDGRGFFLESYNRKAFTAALGWDGEFVQDNHSGSARGVLRGLHYQITRPQAKLVRVLRGAIFDVALDLRRSSPTFGRWFGMVLDAETHQQLWIPAGFAHGFQVTSESAEIAYKTTDYYDPQSERSVAWNDSQLAIAWPLPDPILSAKDQAGTPFSEAECYA